MKHNYLIALSLRGVLLSCLLLSACSKNDIDINFPLPGGGTSQNGTGGADTINSYGKKIIYFDANVVSMLGSKALASTTNDPIASGRNIKIDAYSNSYWVNTNYYVSTLGSLDPANGYGDMTLPNGTYSFYAVGINSSGTTLPAFSNAKASTLVNQADYIWSEKLNYSPPASSNTVNLNFTHSCTQVLLCLQPTTGVSVSKVNMSITPPDSSGCAWNMLTGVITPATSIISTPRSLNTTITNGNYWCQMIMMPVSESAGDLESMFTVTLNSETTPRKYNLTLPMQTGGLLAGKAYVYYTTLTADTVAFSNVTVANWQYVNVDDGTPVIPNQSFD